MKKRAGVIPLLVVLLVGGAAWYGLKYYQVHRAQLGAGRPLDQTYSKIAVLSPSGDVASTLPTATSSSAVIGAPAPIIPPVSALEPIGTPPTAIGAPTLSPAEIKQLKLGTALSLLLPAYTNANPATLNVLESAMKLADEPLLSKLAALKHLGAPVILPALAAQVRQSEPMASKAPLSTTAWWQKWVKVQRPEAKPAAPVTTTAVSEALAANDPAAALAAMGSTAQYDDLRQMVRLYQQQQLVLAEILALYAATLTEARP